MRTAPQHSHQHSKRITSLFSCAFFRQCTESPVSPTPPHSSPPHLRPSLPLPSPSPRLAPSHPRFLPLQTPLPPSPPHHHSSNPSSSLSSSSSSASHSFTQLRFPPTYPPPNNAAQPELGIPLSELNELFHMVELHFTCGSESDRLAGLHLMERILVPNPPSDAILRSEAVLVPTAVMSGVIESLKEHVGMKPATKVLLALCLAEGNRRMAVECGAPAHVVDALPDLHGSVAERALAALDLMCTVPDGAAQVRGHAVAVPMLVATMGRMEGRGREYSISVLTAVYGCEDHQVWSVAPGVEVARAVMLAMQQGDCSARGKRKGAQLLKVLQEKGSVDLTQ